MTRKQKRKERKLQKIAMKRYRENTARYYYLINSL